MVESIAVSLRREAILIRGIFFLCRQFSILEIVLLIIHLLARMDFLEALLVWTWAVSALVVAIATVDLISLRVLI